MRSTVKIILIATAIAFSMQSTAMAKWQLKPPEEIAKNLLKRGAKHAEKNPDQVKAITKKIAGDDAEPTDAEKNVAEKEPAENNN